LPTILTCLVEMVDQYWRYVLYNQMVNGFLRTDYL